ncbi:hypothetical protein OR16_01820 [Cupriavidus basilensis OR16]|uniref:Oxalate:formate antiporter n=1 Tax=Cupriavidus basilensis OR16 TaxID=1127483 RepID=H1RYM8_9BURK|nr:hypothetical protein [Cupriavidus basilensis]EHP44719.1 hypothetical protein OR16_01820 [Cupriavidus basilensis OR16]
MDSALLLGLALGLIALGVGVTFLIATRVPTPVLVRAQEHGRFAGLGSSQETAGIGRASPASRGVRAEPQLARA